MIFWSGLILALLYFPFTKFFFSQEKSINVFTWGDILERSVIDEFEHSTGIKVHLSYYASNEELLVKLKATEGKGYDLIIPSDYSVQILREEGLLKKLDPTKLSFYSSLNPTLLNHPFDPENQFSIPFEWELFVLGIDKNFFKNRPLLPSWKMIFDPAIVQYQIGMINDPVEAIAIAAFYLYGSVETLSEAQLQEVIHLLIEQKKRVTAYAEFRADYFLASKNCPVVLTSTSYIWRAMRRFDFISFVVPKEGTFVTIENLCIPAASQKEEITYKLLNFLYRPESMKTHYTTYGVFPATLDVMPELGLDKETEALFKTSKENFHQFHFMRTVASQQAIRDAWIQVKSTH